MNSRERYAAITHFQPFDRLFHHEMRGFAETYKRWWTEGLRRDDDFARVAGYDRFETVPANVGLLYAFDYETLELTPEYETYRDGDGVIKKKLRDVPEPAMPQYLEFPLKNREIWKRDCGAKTWRTEMRYEQAG